jgi:serine/threonine protein phosphatase PrpC
MGKQYLKLLDIIQFVNNQLSYNLDQDNEIYLKKEVYLTNQQLLKISACTRAGTRDGIIDKPNEDAFSITQSKDVLYTCVFDGNSSLKPIEALGEITGARFASHFLSPLFSNIAPVHNSAKQIMIDMNSQLLQEVLKFEGTNTEDTHTLPATSATILIIDSVKKKISFSHIGDTFFIVYYENGHSRLLTNDKIKPFDEATFKAIKKVAKVKNISPKLATKDPTIRSMLVKRYTEYDNRADGSGYGELNGQANALQYIQTESLSTEKIKSVLIGSDGVIPQGWNIDEENDRQKFRAIIENEGMEGLIKIKKSLEDSDPNFENYTRYKHSDDATAVYIRLM